jgi:hypothetical protein
MAMYKNIFWREDFKKDRKGRSFANIHILVGYNQRSIKDYEKMLKELRKTFPEIGKDDCTCGSIIKSSYCYGFSILAVNTYIHKGEYPGWRQYGPDDEKCEYCYN